MYTFMQSTDPIITAHLLTIQNTDHTLHQLAFSEVVSGPISQSSTDAIGEQKPMLCT